MKDRTIGSEAVKELRDQCVLWMLVLPRMRQELTMESKAVRQGLMSSRKGAGIRSRLPK